MSEDILKLKNHCELQIKSKFGIEEHSLVLKIIEQLQAKQDKENKLREYCEARLEIARNDCIPARSLTLQEIIKIIDGGNNK